jgi:hypothetical protein
VVPPSGGLSYNKFLGCWLTATAARLSVIGRPRPPKGRAAGARLVGNRLATAVRMAEQGSPPWPSSRYMPEADLSARWGQFAVGQGWFTA